MANHSGHLVEPSDEDRAIIANVLAGCVSTGNLLNTYIKLIRKKHLFLEVEANNLQWVLTHINEAVKELMRLGERVNNDQQDLSDK